MSWRQVERNDLRSFPCRPLASACFEQSRDRAVRAWAPVCKVETAAIAKNAVAIPALKKDFHVHPIQLVATIYHSIGLDPATLIYNHLNQPREMVQAEIVDGLLA